MPIKELELFSVTWNEPTKDLEKIATLLRNDTPVLLHFDGIADKHRCQVAKEMATPRYSRNTQVDWAQCMTTDATYPDKTVGDAQLATFRDPNETYTPTTMKLWYGMCRTLSMLPRTSTGTTVVGNAIRDNLRTWRKIDTGKPAYGRELINQGLADRLKSVSKTTHFTPKEWDDFDIDELVESNTFIQVGNKYYEPASSCRTKPHWHAPPVINVHLFGSAYKVYKLKSWKNATTSEKSGQNPFVPEWVARIGGTCRANAILFPTGMLHEITTHAGNKLRVPRTVSDVQRLSKRLATVDPEFLDTYLEDDGVQQLENSKSVQRLLRQAKTMTLYELWNKWREILNPIGNVSSGTIAALYAAVYEPRDRRLYLGIGTYAVISLNTNHVFEQLKRFRNEKEWMNQLDVNRTRALAELQKMYHVWNKQMLVKKLLRVKDIPSSSSGTSRAATEVDTRSLGEGWVSDDDSDWEVIVDSDSDSDSEPPGEETVVLSPRKVLESGKRPQPVLESGKRPQPPVGAGKRPQPVLESGKRPPPPVGVAPSLPVGQPSSLKRSRPSVLLSHGKLSSRTGALPSSPRRHSRPKTTKQKVTNSRTTEFTGPHRGKVVYTYAENINKVTMYPDLEMAMNACLSHRTATAVVYEPADDIYTLRQGMPGEGPKLYKSRLPKEIAWVQTD